MFFDFSSGVATVREGKLLLGSLNHQTDYAMLKENGVTHILQVGQGRTVLCEIDDRVGFCDGLTWIVSMYLGPALGGEQVAIDADGTVVLPQAGKRAAGCR